MFLLDGVLDSHVLGRMWNPFASKDAMTLFCGVPTYGIKDIEFQFFIYCEFKN